jgi:hypothetical protein
MIRAIIAWCRGLIASGFTDRDGTERIGEPCWLCERAPKQDHDDLCANCARYIDECIR